MPNLWPKKIPITSKPKICYQMSKSKEGINYGKVQNIFIMPTFSYMKVPSLQNLKIYCHNAKFLLRHKYVDTKCVKAQDFTLAKRM